MRRVLYIASKEILQTRRDRLAALFTLILPVVFTVFLGLIIPDTAEEGSPLPLGVVDQDQTAASQHLIEELAASPVVEVKLVDAQKVETAVQNQEVAAGLIIPRGYEAARTAQTPVALTLIRLDTLAAAQTAQQAVQDVLSRADIVTRAVKVAAEQLRARTGTAPDLNSEANTENLEDSAQKLVKQELDSPRVALKVTDAKGASTLIPGGFDQSSTGSLVTWVLFSLLTIATTLPWERKQGLLRRLAVAGVGATTVLSGKTLAMVAMTLLQQIFLVLLGQFAFGVDYLSSPGALVITMVSLSALASTLGLLVSSLFRSEAAVVAVTIIVAQLLGALSGGWFPLEITSSTFSRVAHVLPTAWIVEALHRIVLEGVAARDLLLHFGIVWAWVVPLFFLAVWRFRAAARY